MLFTFLCLNIGYSQVPDGPGGVGSSSDVQIWLDATKISASNGDPISIWSDVSGNGNDFSQASAPLQPSYSSNSLINNGPGVSFVSDFLSSGSVANLATNQLTWILVSNTSNTNTQVLLRTDYSSGASFASDKLWGYYTKSTQFISHVR